MNRCALCGRKINYGNHVFGLNCLKKMCMSVDINNVKNLKGETILNNKIRKICDKKSLSQEQTRMLTDRYLTLNILNRVEIKAYDRYRESLVADIEKINQNTSINDLKSFRKITLKQASEINKMYDNNKDIFQKINDGEYDTIQNISFTVIKLAFSLYYNRKPYLSDINQNLQHYILKGGVLGLRLGKRTFAADCLEHSLQENPEDIEIIEGEIVDKIKNDSNFQIVVNNLIKENNKSQDIKNVQKIITFANGDLGLSLHNATLELSGIKQDNKWNLDIQIKDLYDFTELKKLQEYMNNNGKYEDNIENFAASVGNNLAIIGNSCKVVNTYNITIKFSIENLEV